MSQRDIVNQKIAAYMNGEAEFPAADLRNYTLAALRSWREWSELHSEDMHQDACARFIGAINAGKIDPSRSPVHYYVGIVRNRMLVLYQNVTTGKRIELGGGYDIAIENQSVEDGDPDWMNEDSKEGVRKLIEDTLRKNMDVQSRPGMAARRFLRHVIDGVPQKVIAEEDGVTFQAVSHQHNRTLKILRRVLDPEKLIA